MRLGSKHFYFGEAFMGEITHLRFAIKYLTKKKKT